MSTPPTPSDPSIPPDSRTPAPQHWIWFLLTAIGILPHWLVIAERRTPTPR